MSRGEVPFTACGGTCGPSGFMIELGEGGQLNAGLHSTCKCCTPMTVEEEDVTFDCKLDSVSIPVTFRVPTKQSQCSCNACADSGVSTQAFLHSEIGLKNEKKSFMKGYGLFNHPSI